MSTVGKLMTKFKRVSRYMRETPHIYQYPRYYRKMKIVPNTVLIESNHGGVITGHLFYMTKELIATRLELELFIVARDVEKTTNFLKSQQITNVQVVEFLSKQYCKLLASAEYLLNDTTFYPFFNKKKGQKYINTWHGTPLKTLGKDVEVITDVSNVQRNFYMTDMIISSNEYTRDILASSQQLDGVYQGKMITAPSARNGILLDKKKGLEIRKLLQLENKRTVFYMPTWRGTVGEIVNTNDKVLSDLRIISEQLSDDTQFFVKLHPFQEDIDLTSFDNVKIMPSEYELYEFLTTVDVLVTDYSSIMYDFLLRDKKIILYTYDKEEYFSTRGVYESIDNYPFPQANTVEELIAEIEKPDVNGAYAEMKERFCPYDSVDGAKILCDYIWDGKENPKIQESSLKNEKETVVILSGGFPDNGITTALLNTFDNIDTTERNYITIFGKSQLKPQHYFRAMNLPEGVTFYPITGGINGSLIDRILYNTYLRMDNGLRVPFVRKRVAKMMEEEFYRIFGDIKIHHFLHYTGFERKYAELIKHVPTNINTIMFVHTDMFQHYEARKDFNRKVIFSAYETVSKVALVNKNLKENLVKHLPSIKEKIVIMDNFLGEQRIQKLSQENLFATLVDTEVDFSHEGNIKVATELNLEKILARKEDFFRSSSIFKEYASLDVIDKLMASEEFEAVKKIQAADKLLIAQQYGLTKSRMLNDLFDEEVTCFINIGRYDYSKGHERLIKAFEQVYLENQNTRLIIIAPHGRLKRETLAWANSSSAKSAIYILGRMSNPYSLLKHCDAFVLSSHFEGLGLVLYEALAVGTTGITVNLAETIEYLDDEAIIVDNSEAGIAEGMKRFLQSGAPVHTFDFSIPKKRSLKQFEELMTRE